MQFPVSLAEFLGQDIRADHGDAGAAADRRAGRIPGVTDERDATGSPMVHDDLADGVEVEVLGGVRLGQQPGNLPPADVAGSLAGRAGRCSGPAVPWCRVV